MNKILIFTLIVFMNATTLGQGNFNEKPWEKENYPIIIDPYQGNNLDFNKIITDKRVIGLIHKASQGFKADTKYLERSKIAKSKNLLFASYHLGTKENPVTQADFYLKTIKDNLNEPMALDIEDIGGNNISLENAEKFIARIYEKTKKYPFVYVNNKVLNEINSKFNRQSIFSKCPLWYARFLSTLPNMNNKVWDKVTLWQFSCELNCKKTGECLYNVPGTSFDIDVNAFNGTKDELLKFWNTNNINDDDVINKYMNNNFKNTNYKKQLIGNFCNNSSAYYVVFFNKINKIIDRIILYNSNGLFKNSNKFFYWCGDNPMLQYLHNDTAKETKTDFENLLFELTTNSNFVVTNNIIYKSKEKERELSGRREFNFADFIEEVNECK